MKHKESDLQIRCVKWFRYQYPEYARLLEHPHNEGNAFNRRQQSIANAEGVTKGVADLILHVPSYITWPSLRHSDSFHSLAIEMKTPKGTQSPEQKTWQRLFEAAGGRYVIIRSYDDFVVEVTRYMLFVPLDIDKRIKQAYADILRKEDEKLKKQMQSFLNKSE